MLIRKLLASAAGVTMVASTWTLIASPASAEPLDGARADANDIVGVGSDTTQFAMHYIADGYTSPDGVEYPGYNDLIAPNPADAQLVTYDAFSDLVVDDCPTAPTGVRPAHPVAGRTVECLELRTGEELLWRPNGSGNGKRTLYTPMTGPGADLTTKDDDVTVGGSSGNPSVNFARSSAPIQAGAELGANLWAFPFAFDGFKPGVSAAATNAPATISSADFLKIYKGEITNWSEIGGKAGVIKPLVPQPGSGTYQVFNTSMTTLNGGDAEWNKNPNSVFAQEHDPTLVQDDPNAVAPFSTGRAKAFATSVSILAGGWSVDRALFNVVRNADLDADFVSDLFGEDGFLCSAAAQPLIEGSGFEQLAPPSLGGICGEPTQGTPSNFVTSPDRATATDLVASSSKPGVVKLVATVDKAIEGTVEFFESGDSVGEAAVISRQATLTVKKVKPGAHRYTAVFTPADTEFGSSESIETSVKVKTSSKVTESFPAKVAKGKKAKGVVTVKGDGASATGKVMVKLGKKTIANAKLKSGKASITLPKLPKGKNKLTAIYAGSNSVAGSSKSFTIKQK
ncbi:MAG: Ig-like domain repeat protein [Nocardioides sp.]